MLCVVHSVAMPMLMHAECGCFNDCCYRLTVDMVVLSCSRHTIASIELVMVVHMCPS